MTGKKQFIQSEDNFGSEQSEENLHSDELEQLDNNEQADEWVSKTQLKMEAKALQEFGKTLTQLPKNKLKSLPLNETTVNAILDFQKQSGHSAEKRQLAFIGKCLRHDDVEPVQKILAEESFSQLRAMNSAAETGKTEQPQPAQLLLNLLIQHGDQQIQKLLEKHPQISRQNLRQLLRNVQNAKTDGKRQRAQNKLLEFIQNHRLEIE